MIGIEAIGTYIPAGRIDNRQRMVQFGVGEAFLLEKTGMLRQAVKAYRSMFLPENQGTGST
jgi:3-oxoacyl-[acyl-carrier-protein] synthase-3